MTFTTPDTFYLVLVDFLDIGFGSGGDIQELWDDAVDEYAEWSANHPARVFRLEMDADNQPASFVEVTADAVEELAKRMEHRA